MTREVNTTSGPEDIKDSFTLIQNAGLGEISQVRISGGGAKSPLWRQIMADVLGVELVTVNTTEGAAFGAALGQGRVGAAAMESIGRNPNAADKLFLPLVLTLALLEALALYGFVIAIILSGKI